MNKWYAVIGLLFACQVTSAAQKMISSYKKSYDSENNYNNRIRPTESRQLQMMTYVANESEAVVNSRNFLINNPQLLITASSTFSVALLNQNVRTPIMNQCSQKMYYEDILQQVCKDFMNYHKSKYFGVDKEAGTITFIYPNGDEIVLQLNNRSWKIIKPTEMAHFDVQKCVDKFSLKKNGKIDCELLEKSLNAAIFYEIYPRAKTNIELFKHEGSPMLREGINQPCIDNDQVSAVQQQPQPQEEAKKTELEIVYDSLVTVANSGVGMSDCVLM